jgi:hypothetical protein
MIEKAMSPAYDIVCQLYYYLPPKNGADQTDTSALSLSSFDLPKEFFQMLTACGPYLHRDTQLLQKVTSIFLALPSLHCCCRIYMMVLFSVLMSYITDLWHSNSYRSTTVGAFALHLFITSHD